MTEYLQNWIHDLIIKIDRLEQREKEGDYEYSLLKIELDRAYEKIEKLEQKISELEQRKAQ